MAFNLAPTDESFLRTASKRYEETFSIARPAADVWAELTRDNTLDWCRLMKKGATWTSPRPFGVGTTRRASVLGGLLKVDEQYFAWEEGRRKAFCGVKASMPLFKRLAEEYVVEPDGDGACTFRWLVVVEPSLAGRPGGPVNSAVFRSLFKDTAKHFGTA
ncbi:MAG: SRPBCC family protein [Solirubrobacteraceae bacterium]